jgi:hypothetical protein
MQKAPVKRNPTSGSSSRPRGRNTRGQQQTSSSPKRSTRKQSANKAKGTDEAPDIADSSDFSDADSEEDYKQNSKITKKRTESKAKKGMAPVAVATTVSKPTAPPAPVATTLPAPGVQGAVTATNGNMVRNAAAEPPGTPVTKKPRFHSSPTKRRENAPAPSATSETVFILAASKNGWCQNFMSIDRFGVRVTLKLWNKVQNAKLHMGHVGKFIEIDKLPVATNSAKWGGSRQLTIKTTVTQAAEENHFDVSDLLLPSIRKPDHDLAMGTAFLLYASIKMAEIENHPSNKAPNFRGTVQSGGVLADTYGWMGADILDTIGKATTRAGNVVKPLYVLADVVRVNAFGAPGYYELKMSSEALLGDADYMAAKMPALHTAYLLADANYNTPGAIKDDTFPRITAWEAAKKIQSDAENASLFVKATIEIMEAGAALTVPTCSTPDCSLQCEYDNDEGPFTCNDHGDITDPVVTCRCTATIVVKTQDNRHGFADTDLVLSCTIGKNQEEVYLGMTLEQLQDEIDVDAIRDGLKGQRFTCTLIISKKNITAVRLQKCYTNSVEE